MEEGGERSEYVNADKSAVAVGAKNSQPSVEWHASKSPSETRLVVEHQPSTIPKRR